MLPCPVTRSRRVVPQRSRGTVSGAEAPGPGPPIPIYPCGVSSETPADGAGPGDRLVRVGGVIFLIGAVATVVTVAPLFLGRPPFPTAAYLISMLMGLGFAVAGAGVLRTIAAQRRQARGAGEA